MARAGGPTPKMKGSPWKRSRGTEGLPATRLRRLSESIPVGSHLRAARPRVALGSNSPRVRNPGLLGDPKGAQERGGGRGPIGSTSQLLPQVPLLSRHGTLAALGPCSPRSRRGGSHLRDTRCRGEVLSNWSREWSSLSMAAPRRDSSRGAAGADALESLPNDCIRDFSLRGL